MSNTKILNTIPTGETFKIGNFEFIKFTDENGVVTAVSKNVLFKSQFGENNDFSKSYILKELTAETLPEIEAIVGAENVVEFETDLLSIDGSAKHGTVKSKISLPTLDFYRRNRTIFEKYKIDSWWWLSTPNSTSEYNSDDWCVCVAPSGNIGSYYCDCDDNGLRPILTFVSSISVSCE